MYQLNLQHRQSMCHARCNQWPPETCPQPRWGTRSHGSQSQTKCRSLQETKIRTLISRLHFNRDSSASGLFWGKPSQVSTQRWQDLTEGNHFLPSIMADVPLLTLFTVWFSIFQVERVVSYWLLTVSAQKAVDVPGLFEGVYHLLDNNANNAVRGVIYSYFIHYY